GPPLALAWASRQIIRADALRVRLRDSGDARGKGHSDKARTAADDMDYASDELQRAAARLRAPAGCGHAARRVLAGGGCPRRDLYRQPADRLTRGRPDQPFPASAPRLIDAGDGVAALPATTTQTDSEDDLGARIELSETRWPAHRHRLRLPLAAFEFRLRRKT